MMTSTPSCSSDGRQERGVSPLVLPPFFKIPFQFVFFFFDFQSGDFSALVVPPFFKISFSIIHMVINFFLSLISALGRP